MSDLPDDALLREIEARAAEMTRGAGAVLAGYFGKSLDVEFKDEAGHDPVTNADKETQELLGQAIGAHFPDHSILGEEDDPDEDSTANDFVWALDPLDGTKNFVAGLPVYASSVGVMYRGVPVVGALFIPWPGGESGAVLHARRGGGAFMEDERISVIESDEPQANSLISLPGAFGGRYRLRKTMRGKVGELRVTGSIAYELAMVAKGVLQYTVTTGPHLWDVVGGAVLVKEAGGLATVGRRAGGFKGLLGGTQWDPAESLIPDWESGVTTTQHLRRWLAPMVVGSPGAVRYVTSNMRDRASLKGRVRRLARAIWSG